jgi:ribonuclease VapC
MIFVDASAIVAILNEEPESARFIAILDTDDHKTTSPIALFEAAAAITRERQISPSEAACAVQAFLAEAEVTVEPITERISIVAIEAFDRFGKGRHRARLNLGDCFAYACARAHNAELLFKGDDFAHTDMSSAEYSRVIPTTGGLQST